MDSLANGPVPYKRRLTERQVYQELGGTRPYRSFFESTSKHPNKIASGIAATSMGNGMIGSRMTTGINCEVLRRA